MRAGQCGNRRFYRSGSKEPEEPERRSALPSRLERNPFSLREPCMNIPPEIAAIVPEMKEWRHHIHADLDALHIQERSGVPYASRNEGRMHACGHDGHTTMLLGAARALTHRKRVDGTVYFIFQPAEENEGGGRVMVEEGLFGRFPMREVYGMQNWPRMRAGTFAVRAGPLMGAFDIFEVVATGNGAHAAMAYQGKDP